MVNTKKSVSADEDLPAEPTSAPPLSEKDAAALHAEAGSSEDADTPQDSVVDEAVDDITRHEADEVLAAEDAELAEAFDPKAEKTGFKARLKHIFHAWWDNKKFRYATFAGLAVIILLTAIIPQSRYFVLNTVGVRGSTSVIVIDSSTQQPLKNVDVQAAGVTVKTDGTGTAKLTHVKLGKTEVTISRRAFATVHKKVTLGWGSNPLGNVSLAPTGSQYNFTVTDFLSNKPIAKAEANSEAADAVADENGQIVLTLDANVANLSVTVKAEGYRDVSIPLNLDDRTTHKVAMVPSQKHAFVSKRSGKYDLYTIDVDGTNEKVVLAGTGNEREDIAVVPHPSDDIVALVSSRDNSRNKDGYLLSTLNIIDTKSGERTQVSQSEQIEIIDWIGSRLIFVQVAAGASANNPNRQRLISYDFSNNSQKELASSNYFFDLVSANGVIYYSTSDVNPSNQPAFYKINADGTNRLTILNKEVWNIFRIKYDHLTLAVGNDWYDYKLGDTNPNKLNGAPSSQESRAYQDDSGRKNALWVESRDGKGVLLKYDVTAQKDTVLRTQSGLSTPIYWLNDHYAVYRIHTDQETADYVLNLDGGQPKKIGDVTNTAGLGQWYYYR